MTSLGARLSRHVELDESGCWLWTGALNSRGYSCIGVDGKSQLAHRVSYELHVGPIPEGLQIDHLCRVKRCINPEHLEPVTAQENCARTPEAMKTHCVNGHELSGWNLMVKARRSGRVIRNCRTCHNAANRAAAARRKEKAA